jgi:hypothetical protein
LALIQHVVSVGLVKSNRINQIFKYSHILTIFNHFLKKMNENNNNEQRVPNLIPDIPDNPTNRVGGLSPRAHLERVIQILRIEREWLARGVMVIPSNVCQLRVPIDWEARANVENAAINRGVNVISDTDSDDGSTSSSSDGN